MEIRQRFAQLVVCGLVVLGLVVVAAPSQEAFGWTSTTGSVSAFLGSGQVSTTGVEVDANGNIYTTGVYRLATDFDPSPTTSYTLTPASANFAGFIVKMNSDGELLWAGHITGSGRSAISDLSIDSSGNVLLVGDYTGTVDLDPGTGTTTVQSSGSGAVTNMFVVRLTPAGTMTWSHTLPTLSYGYNVDVDSSDNFVVSGEYAGTNVDFDPGAGTATLTNGGNGGFVWSVATTGTHRWVKQPTGNYTRTTQIATDSSGNVYICGTYQGTTSDFDPGAGTANQASTSNSNDFYLWSLDQNGNYRWVTTFGNSDPEACHGMNVSPSGNILVSGSFYTTVDIGRNGSNELTAISGEDYFYGMFDSTGANMWIYNHNFTGLQKPIFSGTSAWFVGGFNGTVDFNPDVSLTNNLVSRGNNDAVIVEFNTAGIFQRAFSYGGNTGSENIAAVAIAGGHLYLSGYFGSTPANFNTGSGTAVNVSATGTYSGYVNKLTVLGEVVTPTTTTTTSTTTSTTVVTSTTNPSVTTTTIASEPKGSSGSGTSRPSTTIASGLGNGPTNTNVVTTSSTVPGDEVPDIMTVKPGEVGVTIDGKPVIVTLTNDDGTIVATAGETSISYSVFNNDGTKRVLSVDAFSVLRAGDRVKLKFRGFQPSGKSRAWLAPSGTFLGESALVNGIGTVEEVVPQNVEAGEMRIIASAESESGQPIVFAYGVSVDEGSSARSPWPVVLLVVVGLGIFGGLIIPAAKRRRDKEEQ